jgi:hypothetical protein
MNRRSFITLFGGAAAWPLPARARQPTGPPLVGLLNPLSPAAAAHVVGAFRRGMRDLGYVEGANVAFAFRFADGQVANLPALANELVALKPAVIAVGSPAAVLETYKATRTTPIVMVTSKDRCCTSRRRSVPLRPSTDQTAWRWLRGLVHAFKRPGGLRDSPGTGKTSPGGSGDSRERGRTSSSGANRRMCPFTRAM